MSYVTFTGVSAAPDTPEPNALERKLAVSKREQASMSAELERLKAVAKAGNDILGSSHTWAEKLRLLGELHAK